MDQTTGIVYKTPCTDCDKVYIGETSIISKTRKEEHKEDSDEARLKHYTRGNRKRSEKEFNKSAITDHVSQNNHTLSWKEASIIAQEGNWFRRGIREAFASGWRRDTASTVTGSDMISLMFIIPISSPQSAQPMRGYSQSSDEVTSGS